MYRYVIKRLIVTIPTLIGVAFIVFFIMNLTPGDPARMILGDDATQEQIDQMNQELGLDKPFFTRFAIYIKDIVTKFDFGNSYRTRAPVIDDLIIRFPTTFKLAVISVIFGTTVGVALGILSAVKQYSLIDNASTVFAMFFAAIPGFWFGMILILIFALNLRILPSNGADSWKHFILPMLANSVGSAASLLRMTRSTMLETIRQDYIRTARAKGASESVVIWKHALKNAILPVVTLSGMNLGFMLGGTVVTETVFAMQGIGSYVVEAIRQKDIPAVLTCTLFLSFMFCIVMLLVDLLYAFIDPRIKAKYSR